MERVCDWMKNVVQGLFHSFWGGIPDRNDESRDDSDSDTQSSDYYFDESSDDSDEAYDGPHFGAATYHWKIKAVKLREEKEKFKKKAKTARENGDSEEADKWENEAKEASREFVDYNMKHNPRNTYNTIDLHGLSKKEAINEVGKALRRGIPTLYIITGKGIHSKNGRPKLKPEVEKFLDKKNYQFGEVEGNSGRLRVQLR